MPVATVNVRDNTPFVHVIPSGDTSRLNVPATLRIRIHRIDVESYATDVPELLLKKTRGVALTVRTKFAPENGPELRTKASVPPRSRPVSSNTIEESSHENRCVVVAVAAVAGVAARFSFPPAIVAVEASVNWVFESNTSTRRATGRDVKTAPPVAVPVAVPDAATGAALPDAPVAATPLAASGAAETEGPTWPAAPVAPAAVAEPLAPGTLPGADADPDAASGVGETLGAGVDAAPVALAAIAFADPGVATVALFAVPVAEAGKATGTFTLSTTTVPVTVVAIFSNRSTPGVIVADCVPRTVHVTPSGAASSVIVPADSLKRNQR